MFGEFESRRGSRVVALTVAAFVIAACGSDPSRSGSSESGPQVSSSFSTVATTTLAAAATGTTAAVPPTTAPVPPPTAPVRATTTSVPSVSTGGYREVPATSLLTTRDDGTTDPITDPLTDGVFYADSYALTSDGTAVQFNLARFLNIEACVSSLDTVSEGTVDYAPCFDGSIDDGSTATVTMRLDSSVPVIVVDADYRCFEVTASEFGRLLGGEPPSSDAPDGFEYQPYWAALIEVADGTIVRVSQMPSS